MKFFSVLLCLVMSSTLLLAQDFSIDKVKILVEPEKNQTLLGERYQATISLSHELPDHYEMSCSVNGSQLLVKDQKALYTNRPSSTGNYSYTITIRLTNTKNKEVEVIEKNVSYFVYRTSVSVWVDKMNVFFVGVDNPITISSDLIDYKDMEVTAPGAKIINRGRGHYVIRPSKSGKQMLRIHDTKSKRDAIYEFRVKRIPNPVVRFGKIGSGKVSLEDWNESLGLFTKGTPGLAAWLDNFDFDARCKVTEFTFFHYRKKRLKLEEVNKGYRCSDSISKALKNAKSGDLFIFTDVKGTCPMDEEDRAMNSVVLRIE